MYACSLERMKDKIATFSKFGDAGHGGITRYSLSEAAIQARNEFRKRMEAIGAVIEIDDVANMYATLPGSDPNAKRIVMASHVDSVKNGGNYDGILGVMSAMEVLETVHEKKIPHKHPLTDALAISAAKRIFHYLPLAYQDGKNREAREEMAAAALEAGICINNSSVTIVHGMSRPIGALFHVPHGLSNAMLLDKCLQFALPGCYERFGVLGRAIGAASADSTDSEAADALLQAVKLLCYTCEVPTPEQYGIAKTTFFNAVEKMAADAIASGSPGNTRREVTAEDCAAIYYSLWEN